MNPQDKSFMTIITGVIAVLVLLTVAIFFIARSITLFTPTPDVEARKQITAEDRIEPVGQVVVAEPGKEEPAPAVERTGEEIVTSVCSSCHATGVLGAPKTGDTDAWAARFERGLDTLVQSAILGVRAMPPKGGDPNLTENDIRKAVTYILQESGVEVAAAEEAPEAAPEEEAAPAEEAPPAADKPAGVDLAQGKQVYSSACFACHDTGAAGAPKIGDKAVWEPRAEQGFDTLVTHAINGIGAMPPKGGNPNLSDEQVRNSVAYMLDETGIQIGPLAEAEAAAPEQPAPAEEEAPKQEAAPGEAVPAEEAEPAEEKETAPAEQEEMTPDLPEEAAQPPAQLKGPAPHAPFGQEPQPHVPSKTTQPPAQEEPVLEIPGQEPAPVSEEETPAQ